MRHPGAEFPPDVKVEALRRANYRCEQCGKKGYLEIHHILPIYVASLVYQNLPHAALRSMENAMCLCSECHSQAHEQGWHEWDYTPQATILYGMFNILEHMPGEIVNVPSPDAPRYEKRKHGNHSRRFSGRFKNG